MDVPLPVMTPASLSGSQGSAGTSRLKELYEKLQERTFESRASDGAPATWRIHPVVGAIISSYKKNFNAACKVSQT